MTESDKAYQLSKLLSLNATTNWTISVLDQKLFPSVICRV